ncbi:MAG TPA: MFS transporter, partial [Candidatus Methylacidiphilales bacterium]
MSSGPSPVLPGTPTPSPRDPYSAFRHASYRYFFFGRLLFMLGSQMQTAAVGWLLYERFGTTMALAYVGLVQIVPIFCFVLPSGHLADRLDRRRIVVAGQVVFFLCSLSLGLIALEKGPAQWIYPVLFFLATARVFSMPAMGALLSTVIPRAHLGNATTWNSSIIELSGLVGPALAGGLIALTRSATPVFFVAMTCSLCTLVLISLVKIERQVPVAAVSESRAAGEGAKPTTWRDLLGGVSFLLRNRILLAAASLDLFATLFGGVTALLPVVAKDILHVGPEGFGLLRAAPSVGAVAMALATAHLPPWRRSGRVLFGAFVGFGLAVIVFGISKSFWLSFAMLVLTGLFDNLNVVIRQTLIQYITPDPMRGRVTSINFLFIGCSNELGAFESGVAARYLGTVPSIVLGGVGTLVVVAAVMRLSPDLRRLGLLHEVKPI